MPELSAERLLVLLLLRYAVLPLITLPLRCRFFAWLLPITPLLSPSYFRAATPPIPRYELFRSDGITAPPLRCHSRLRYCQFFAAEAGFAICRASAAALIAVRQRHATRCARMI
jgi:hypothetical protein